MCTRNTILRYIHVYIQASLHIYPFHWNFKYLSLKFQIRFIEISNWDVFEISDVLEISTRMLWNFAKFQNIEISWSFNERCKMHRNLFKHTLKLSMKFRMLAKDSTPFDCSHDMLLAPKYSPGQNYWLQVTAKITWLNIDATKVKSRFSESARWGVSDSMIKIVD